MTNNSQHGVILTQSLVKLTRKLNQNHQREDASAPSLLTLDNVSFHHDVLVAELLRKQRVHMSNFPPNTTCRLQPLDHSIMGVIKRKLADEWDEWMDRPNPTMTKHGNLQVVQKETLLTWIAKAWSELKPESIKKSFDSCWMTKVEEDDYVVVESSSAADV